MALVQAEVDLANQALGRIGGKQFTLAVQAGFSGVQANLHFAQTRQSLLRSFDWSFATDRIALSSTWATATTYTTDQYVWEDDTLYKCAEAHTSGTFATDLAAAKWTDVDSTNNTDFGNYYDLPADWIRVKEYYDDDNTEWSIEGTQILTPDTDVELVYIFDEDTTTNWDALFTELFIIKLALNLLNQLAGSGSGALGLRKMLLGEFRLASSKARVVDKQESNDDGYSNWHKARFGSNWRRDLGKDK